MQAVLSLPDQLGLFKEYISKLKALVGEERTNYILANSLFLLVAGSDDLANTYFTFGARRLQYDVPSYADLMVDSASTFIQVFPVLYLKVTGFPEFSGILKGGLIRIICTVRVVYVYSLSDHVFEGLTINEYFTFVGSIQSWSKKNCGVWCSANRLFAIAKNIRRGIDQKVCR